MKRPRSVPMTSAALLLAVGGLCATVRAEAPPSDAPSPPPAKRPAAAATVVGDARPPAVPAPGRHSGKRSHDGLFLRLSLGPVYLHESWSPTGGGAGATFGGWGTSLETSVGKSLRPGLIVGGRWQLVAVVDPNESYLGTTYVADETARFLDVLAAFVDYYPNPRRGFHVGGTIGLVGATNLDAEYGAHKTSWGPALSAHLGYEVFFSSRWSVGALAGLSAYRYSTTEAGVSSVSDGLLPTLALAFTFD